MCGVKGTCSPVTAEVVVDRPWMTGSGSRTQNQAQIRKNPRREEKPQSRDSLERVNRRTAPLLIYRPVGGTRDWAIIQFTTRQKKKADEEKRKEPNAAESQLS